MPQLEQAERNMTLTYFPFISRDLYGIITTGAGVEFSGRWLDIQQESQSQDSVEQAIIAIVVFPYDVPIGSLVWNGELADYEDGTGTAHNELAEVKQVDTVRDIKGQATRYSARCIRYTQKQNPSVS